MGYRYLEELSYADAAFEAEGETLPDLFRSAADALVHLMVEDSASIAPKVIREVGLDCPSDPTEEQLADLLHGFLEKFVYWKDVDLLFLRVSKIEFNPNLVAELVGERIDPKRHSVGTDVKAITYHRLQVRREGRLWKAVVVVDI